jgi:hypothetical protein
MNTIKQDTMNTVAASLLFVADAAIAESFLNDFCKDNKGYVLPAFNSKERKDEAANWKAAFIKAGAKQASLSNLRTALNYGLEAGRFLGANPARAKEALASLNKTTTKTDKVADDKQARSPKVAKSDREKLESMLKSVAKSKALPMFADMFTDTEWHAFKMAVEAFAKIGDSDFTA